MSANLTPYVEARAAKGFWQSHRFGVLRRLAQVGFLALFLTGPLFGLWISKGSLAASMTLNILPLTDPLVFAQMLAARHWPEMTAVIGVVLVVAGYLLAGGRTFCAWVCPINPVADLAAWLRRRLGITQSAKLRPEFRLWLMGAVIIVSGFAGMLVWELVNPVTAVHRALVYGLWFGLLPVAAIFMFDLMTAKHGWCGHLCPVGASYGLIGKAALLRVSAAGRARCDDCMDCFAVCPEPHVIAPALRGDKTGASPVILSGDCTMCAACIDVCPERVFRFALRSDSRLDGATHGAGAATPPVTPVVSEAA
jgi:ferredoxin-type protein NapH